MKKLKNKVFWVLWAILTVFLISILGIWNVQSYRQEENHVSQALRRMDENRNNRIPILQREEQNEEDRIPTEIFMDATIYTAILDTDFHVLEVINHTMGEVSDEQIKEVAEKIIAKDTKRGLYIGNLYLEEYSYLFTKNQNMLIIMEHTSIKETLMQVLRTSFLLFVLLEIVIILLSKKLTKWMIQPVMHSFEKQKQFIADASHELKTPLSVIMASAEVLENEPEEKKWVENIKSEAERMNHLVSNLLEMAKSENAVKEQYKEENLSKIVEKEVLTFESIIYEKELKVEYHIAEDISFLCEANQIKQVISILLDNAIKHSSEKGTIGVILQKEKSNIFLSVKNEGKTIPKEEQEKIFERFYRADASRNRNENRYGLGLAIAKNIVENHKGKILVHSENGNTIFKIVFKIK